MEYLYILLLLLGAAILFSLLIALFVKYFSVKDDPRKDEVMKLMPGVNCGACGYPGCSGLVDALLSEKETHVKKCKVIKADKANEVVEYLNNSTGPNGEKVKVTL